MNILNDRVKIDIISIWIFEWQFSFRVEIQHETIITQYLMSVKIYLFIVPTVVSVERCGTTFICFLYFNLTANAMGKCVC